MSQSSAPPPSAIQRVPVFQTMREAYRAVFTSLPLLMRAAFLPYLLSAAIAILSLFIGQNFFLGIVLTLFSFVPYTLFGVAWHRLTLLGPSDGAPQVFPSWHRRHWRFFTYVMAMTILGWILLLAFGTLKNVWLTEDVEMSNPLAAIAVSWLIPILALFAMLRLSFLFPAAAVDETYTMRDSWVHTRGQTLRLLATLVVVALPIVLFVFIVLNALGDSLLGDIGEVRHDTGSEQSGMPPVVQLSMGTLVAFHLIQNVIGYIVMALSVSAISIAFRTCTGWVPVSAGGPPVAPTGTATP